MCGRRVKNAVIFALTSPPTKDLLSRAGSAAKIYSGCAICSRPCVGSASVQGTDTPSSFRIGLQMQRPPSPWSFPPASDDRPTVSARRRFSGSDAEGLKLKHQESEIRGKELSRRLLRHRKSLRTR